jgi:hypothetical protein
MLSTEYLEHIKVKFAGWVFWEAKGQAALSVQNKGAFTGRKKIWLMYFVYMYENRTIKPVETVLWWG